LLVIAPLVRHISGMLVLGVLAATAPLRPLGGHAVLVLLVQLALLVGFARLLSEIARRLDQPAVIGELLAGILLGPSVLGALAPGPFARLFPPDEAQFHLLEAISWLGMILLLLLTGLEIDVRTMREIGRPAFLASLFGMVVPFAGGYALAFGLPEDALADPGQRTVFAAFLATAMTISAMPVIAKILMDLNLLKRNIGMVTMSAGVLDDTAGWLMLSMISGIAKYGGFQFGRLAIVLGLTALFVLASRYVAYPAVKVALKYVDDRKELAGTDLALIAVVTLVLATVTEAIGIHAVFGAFVAGLILRQSPRLRWRSVDKLDAVVQSVFSPIFFAFVGLRVDLGEVHGLGIIAAVLAVAFVTKIVGCALGGRLGGLTLRESLAIGIGMSARGAMGLVVALVGLSLGILNAEMYSVIVLMAVVTSLASPPLLRLAVRGIALRDEERLRVADDASRPHFRKERLKVLVPMAGGPNAERALALVAPLARHEDSTLTALRVETAAGGPRPSLLRGLFRRKPAAPVLDAFQQAAEVAASWKVAIDRRTVSAPSAAEGIIREAARGYDLLMLGASGERHSLHHEVLEQIIRKSPCHVAIVKNKDVTPRRAYKQIVVPSEGSYFAKVAFEFAAAYAEEVGARVTLLHVLEQGGPRARLDPEAGTLAAEGIEALRATLRAGIEPVLRRFKVEVDVRIAQGEFVNSTIVHEVAAGPYDLLVLGAENRAVLDRLFLGHGTEYVVDHAPCTVVIILPEGISGPSARASRAPTAAHA
jgi:Kef-type K+ transport system membrane component KefB/nucleotide-binding universal stress UspA family protein